MVAARQNEATRGGDTGWVARLRARLVAVTLIGSVRAISLAITFAAFLLLAGSFIAGYTCWLLHHEEAARYLLRPIRYLLQHPPDWTLIVTFGSPLLLLVFYSRIDELLARLRKVGSLEIAEQPTTNLAPPPDEPTRSGSWPGPAPNPGGGAAPKESSTAAAGAPVTSVVADAPSRVATPVPEENEKEPQPPPEPPESSG